MGCAEGREGALRRRCVLMTGPKEYLLLISREALHVEVELARKATDFIIRQPPSVGSPGSLGLPLPE